jgi:PhnB protein
MASTLNPYLNFKDTAREALEFYRDALGGDLNVSTFGDYGDKDAPEANLVMHGQLDTPAGFTLMCSDAPPGMDASVSGGFAVSLSGDDEAELRGYWDKLSAGGEITVPLEKQMWGDTFGMVTDKFGVGWMVNIAGGSPG